MRTGFSTYRARLNTTALTIRARNNIIAKLAGNEWLATANALRTATLALVCSMAEFHSPVRLNNCRVTRIDGNENYFWKIIIVFYLGRQSLEMFFLRSSDERDLFLRRELGSTSKHLSYRIYGDTNNSFLMSLKSRKPDKLDDNTVYHTFKERWKK